MGDLAFPRTGTRPRLKLDAERVAELERKIGKRRPSLRLKSRKPHGMTAKKVHLAGDILFTPGVSPDDRMAGGRTASFRPRATQAASYLSTTAMDLPDAPIPHEGFLATHFFTVRDQEKSKDFYVRILGGKVIKPENPCYIKLANNWIILNSGGGPTPDKPEVILETPSDLNRVNCCLRVANIWTCYKQWADKGASFLTEPLDNHGWEWRCYMRDPDGYIIEVGQYTQMALDRFKNDSNPS